MGVYDRDYLRSDRSGPWFGFSGRGQVVKWLIATNIVVFMIQSMTMRSFNDPGRITDWFELNVNEVMHGQLWRLLTYAFLHAPGSLGHILWNMLFLYWFGVDVEDIYGSREFLGFYLCAAVAGGISFVICHLLGVPGNLCLGASGAVMACLVLCALHYPSRVILLFFILPIPIWFFILFIIVPDVYTLLMGLRYGGDGETVGVFGTGTAVAAHVAGAGFAYCYYKFSWRVMNFWPQFRTWQKRAARPRLRVYREEAMAAPVLTAPGPDVDEHMEAKVDQVLEKVARTGQDSLTDGERQILLRASEVYRRRRT